MAVVWLLILSLGSIKKLPWYSDSPDARHTKLRLRFHEKAQLCCD